MYVNNKIIPKSEWSGLTRWVVSREGFGYFYVFLLIHMFTHIIIINVHIACMLLMKN